LPRGRQTNAVTRHEQRAAIERDLAIGLPLRRIAKKYGGLCKDTLCKYKKRLPPQLKAAMLAQALRPAADLETLRVSESEGLLASLAGQRARLLLWQDAAAASEQYTVGAMISAQVHRNLELVGKYLGEFASHHHVTAISLLVSPEYLELRSALLGALQRHPEARADVTAALHRLETRAAQRATERPALEAVALPAVLP
jgi:hypothetical protein